MTTAALPRFVVGFDVETTALEPPHGELLEVAAIRFDLVTGKEINRFATLLQTYQLVPPFITSLTGITAAIVHDKPFFKDIIPGMKTFLGRDTLFAHNATFDLNWLAYHGLPLSNPVWDTFLLAAVAWPTAPSYNLGFLGKQLKIPDVAEHRAEADVLLTWKVLQQARKSLAGTKKTILAIHELLAKTNQKQYIPLFTEQALLSPRPASPSTAGTGNITQTVAQLFQPGGILEQRIGGFHSRPPQIEMARLTQKTMESGQIRFIEADTGTGKTFAYAVPAIKSSQHQKVFIATYTKNLQDQLYQKDLPALLNALGVTRTVASLKGRSNYLCDQRLKSAMQRPNLLPHEAWTLIKVLRWYDDDTTGDLEELNVSHQAATMLRRLHADSLHCRVGCAQSSTCPYQRAKKAAAAADIVITNHALLCQMNHWQRGTSPAHIIVDEAHHLPEVARLTLHHDLSIERLHDIVSSLGSVYKDSEPITRGAPKLLEDYQELLRTGALFVQQHTSSNRIRLTSAIRRTTSWQQVIGQGKAFLSGLHLFLGLCRGVPIGNSVRQQEYALEAIKEGEQFGREVHDFLHGDEQRIQWLSFSFHDLPLLVTPFFEQLATTAASIIFTSATLSSLGDFSFIKRQTGLKEASTNRIPSVIDYRRQMLIYILEDSPSPNEASFDQYSAETIQVAATLLNGKILGLLTSKKTISSLYNILHDSLYKENIRLLAQGITGGRHAIIERFQEGIPTVLLGTSSFWEGIDIPGEDLSCLVIPKLPFALPDDPVLVAVGEAQRVSVFENVALPLMALRLRQGVGRLLRNPDDKGVVILGDSRFLFGPYRRAVLESLPAATVRIGRQRDLAGALTEWFTPATVATWKKEASDRLHEARKKLS